jgi:hypothetical protein
MRLTRKAAGGPKAFAMPMLGIAVLLLSYFILADWDQVPTLISGALAAVHWAN